MLNIIFFLFYDFALINGKVFLVETKTNSKNIPEYGENYREDEGPKPYVPKPYGPKPFMPKPYGTVSIVPSGTSARAPTVTSTTSSATTTTSTPIITSTPTITSTSQEIIDPIDTGSCNCGMGMPRSEFEEISGGTDAPPTAFPWIVRLVDGCPRSLCAGTLVSPKVVLSAYHCTVTIGDPSNQACDHSDGKRLAVLGSHVFQYQHLHTYEKIPVIQVLAPPHAPLDPYDDRTDDHDFALLVLQYPAKFNYKVSPICLPEPNAEFGGQKAIAAGWGRFAKPSVSTRQSPYLRMVKLSVSPKRYNHTKMFGTVLSMKEDEYQDPCAGDSGGPLMYLDSSSGRYVLIGTVQGGGYDCRTDAISEFEGSDNGVWNKVSAHMEWIQQTMGRLGQRVCKAVTG